MYNDKEMIGRYYEEFEIDIQGGLSNFTQELLHRAIEFIDRKSSSPYFLYWAPDATHAPAYSSTKFHRRSKRSSFFGDAVMEIDWAVGKILDAVRSSQK